MNAVSLAIITSMSYTFILGLKFYICRSIPHITHVCSTFSTVVDPIRNYSSWDNERGFSCSTWWISWVLSTLPNMWQQWSSAEIKTVLFTIGTGALHACVPEALLRFVSLRGLNRSGAIAHFTDTTYSKARKDAAQLPVHLLDWITCHSVRGILGNYDCVWHSHISFNNIKNLSHALR